MQTAYRLIVDNYQLDKELAGFSMHVIQLKLKYTSRGFLGRH